jgi:uncharacterized protein (TIGR00297 family)
VALLAARAGSLSRSGIAGATVVGGIAAAAGWEWAALLVLWFTASSGLTRLGHRTKSARTASALAPSSARSATQVFANGAVFAVCAFSATLTGSALSAVAALGSLAAAAADTWATEIGLLWGGAPRRIIGGERIEPGMSGGVTVAGLLGSVAGALAVATAATLLIASARSAFGTSFDGLRVSPFLLIITTAGVLGGLADSMLGALVQARHWCASCERWTERTVHDCGAPTEHRRGWRWMTNDSVNFITTLVGAGAAVALLAAQP